MATRETNPGEEPTATVTVAVEEKRLVLMQWGLLVAIVSAIGALIMPVAVHAMAGKAAAEAVMQEQVGTLLTRTARLEEAQKHMQRHMEQLRGDISTIEGDIGTIKGDIRTIEADVKGIREQVAANTATLERIDAAVRILLSRSSSSPTGP